MSSIDDRVVNMQFNNASFQKGIGQTTDSINELNQSLKLENATDGIGAVQSAANRFSLSNIESQLSNISSHFSVFGVAAFTVIQDLTNKAIDLGAQIGAALVDPIVDGGEKRALALQQAKFQFQGLGLDIDATMASAKAAVLGTAFSLDQAATAAAVFGSSGVTAGHGLEGALRAIAGVAAQSGASFGDIAQIFEKINGNQRVMSEDLLSLSARGINAAAILAKSLGTTEAKVRDMVSHGKISFQQFSDAMNAAFGANAAKANELFTGALSNMNAALARLGADVQDQKLTSLRDIFNSLSPLIDAVHLALGPLITDINNVQKAGSGKFVLATKLLGPGITLSIQNIVTAIEKIGKAIGAGFGEIFPDNTVPTLTSISIFLQKITEALIPSDKAAGELKRTFAGLFAIFDIVGQVLGAILDAFFKLVGVTTEGSGGILTFTAKVGDLLVKFDEWLKKGDKIKNFFDGIANFIAAPIALIKTFFGIIGDGINTLTHLNSKGFDDFADDVKKRFSGLVDLGNQFGAFWEGVGNVLKAIWNFLGPIFKAIGDGIATAFGFIKNALDGISFDDQIKALNTGIFATIILTMRGFFLGLLGVIKGGGLPFAVQIKTIFGSLRTNLKALEMNTNAKTLKEIAISVALLAASAVALSLVDSVKLTIALVAIGGLIKGLLVAFSAFSKISGTKGLLDTIALSLALQGIATAILILTGAIAILGALPLDNLIQGVIALAVVLRIFVIALESIGKLGPQVLAGAGAIAIIAPAIAVLAGAIAIFGALPLANLVQGTVAFAVVLTALVAALTIMNKNLNPVALIAGAGAIVLISGSIAVLTGAIAALGALPIDNLDQGLIAFVIIMATLLIALGALALIGPEVILGAAAIAIIAFSLIPLIGAIALIGALSWEDLAKGVLGLAAVLVILVAAVLVLGAAAEITLIGAAALVAIAFAIGILAPALKLLSSISWEAMGRLFTVLSAGLGILVVMGILLIPASVGFLLFGVAMLLIGVGVGLAAAGIASLALSIVALVAVGAGGILLIGSAITLVIQMLPQIGAAIGAALVAMAVVIGANAPQLINAFVQLILALLGAINQTVPAIINTAVILITTLVNALVVLIPLLVDAGLKILVGILNGIASNIGGIVTAASNIIINFLNALAAKLPDIIAAGGNLVLSFINGIGDYVKNNSQKFVTAGTKLFNAIVDGIAQAITAGGANIRAAGAKIGTALIKGAQNALGINSPSKVFRDFIMGSVFEGIDDGNDTDRAAAAGDSIGTSITSSAIKAVKNSVAGINDAVNTNIDASPTIKPVLDLTGIQSGAKSLNGLLTSNPALSLATSNDVATSVSLQEQEKNAKLSIEADDTSTKSPSVQFIQNNNSPKSLSVTEIYRQTNNQLSVLKGDLGVVTQDGSPQ